MAQKPDLVDLVWRLYRQAIRLSDELEEVVEEDERKWRYDALTKLVSPLIRLLEMLYEGGEIEEEDLVKLLSRLSSKNMLTRVVMGDRFDETRRFLTICLRVAEREGWRDIAEDIRAALAEVDDLEHRVKSVLRNIGGRR